MKRPLQSATTAAFALAALTLAACGGGGSSSGGGITPSGPSSISPTAPGGATSAPSPTPTTAALSVTGTVTEFTSGVPLSGFTVTVGAIPAFTSCLANQTATTQPCGVAGSPTTTTSTSSTGTFSVAVPAAGTYFLTIALNSAYATLHKEITVTSSGLALGTVHVAALSSDEQNWLIDVNSQRATVSYPASFGNLVVDEYAEEQARATALAIANGAPDTDATGEIYLLDYGTEAGGILGAGGAIGSSNSPGQFVTVDSGFMAEKANCPGGNWQGCTYASNTGHYINFSNTDDVFAGLGEAAIPSTASDYPGEIYDIVFPQDTFNS